ncbi:unnamed protein product [Calypogeia fissa]
MSATDNSPVRHRARTEVKRRYFHKGYLWPWVLILLIPVVLRFVMFYEVTFPFQSSHSSTEDVRSENLQSDEIRDNNGDDVKIPIIHGERSRKADHSGINHSKDRLRNVKSERSIGRDLPVTKIPAQDVKLKLPDGTEEDPIQGVVDEAQLRQIGERIELIKRWENWEERTRWNAEQDTANDELEAGQGSEEKKAAEEEMEEMKAKEEKLARETRNAAHADEERSGEERAAEEIEAEEDRTIVEESNSSDTKKAAEKRRISEEKLVNREKKDAEERKSVDEMEVDEEIRVAGELEAAEERREVVEMEAQEKRDAEEERRLAEEMEIEEDKRAAEEREAEEETRLAEEMEIEEEKRAAEEREAEEELMVAKEREAEEEANAAQRKEAHEQREAGEKNEADEKSAEHERNGEETNPAQRKVTHEQREAGERNGETEKSAEHMRFGEEKTHADEQRKAEKEAEGERNVDEQREAGGEKNGKKAKSAEDTKKGDGSRKEEEQNQAQRAGVEAKNHSEVEEQKTTNDPKSDVGGKNPSEAEEHKRTNDPEDDEKTVKLEQVVEDGKHTVDENQEKGTEQKEQKEEEKNEDSGRKYEDDMTTPIDQTQDASSAAGECDLFDGDWDYDPEGPLYTNSTCFYIRGDHNCMSNGRPDSAYLNWRWKPRGCDLPRFDARAFMEAFRGKTIGFIGDSLARNQMQSMLCMLALVEVPIELHDDYLAKRWLFEQYQVTLSVVWAPYLLKETREGVLGFEKDQSVLYLDVLDPAWTAMLPDCDIIVFSVGQWYFKPSVFVRNDEVVGCHYCPNLNLTEMGFTDSYGEGLRRALEKVAAEWKGVAILSTFASAHGEKNPGDDRDFCRREKPLEKAEWESSFRGMQTEMRAVVLREFNRLVSDKSKLNNDFHIEFLDVSTLSLLRPDGHPGAYYNPHPYEGKSPDEWVFNDCLHWCLPGPIDTWNQLLVKIAQKYL